MQVMEPDASSDAILTGELNEMLDVFSKISGGNQHVDLKTILKLPELKAQITEGDVAIEDLEGAWLEACAVEGDETIDPVNTSGRYRRSWGVCSELAFEGFVRFLSLCEAKTPLPKVHCTVLKTVGPVCRAATEASARARPRIGGAEIGRDLLVARQRMAGLLRATLTVHYRDHGSKKEEGATGGLAPADHGQPPDPDWPRGEALHSAMVRAAVSEGLVRRTPEALKELVRVGVYRVSEKAFLGLSLSTRLSHDDLMRTGILRGATPGEVALERASAAESVRRCLERRPTAKELVDKGIILEGTPRDKRVERAFLAGKLKHDLEHRRGWDELKQKGIALDMAPGEAREQHQHAAENISRRLQARPSYGELRARRIVLTPGEEVARRVEIDGIRGMVEEAKRNYRGRQPGGSHLAGDNQEIDDEYIHEEFERLRGMGIGLDHALASPIVQRWSSLAGWDRNTLVCLWDGDGPAGSVKDLDGFKEFCRAWERKCSAISAYRPRLHESSFQVNAHLEKTQPGEKSPESRPIAAKPTARQSLDAVQRASITRPASEELEDKKRGAKGHGEDEGDELVTKNSRRGEALDATTTHDHARWGSHSSQPGEIPRQKVLGQLRRTGMSKRPPLQELTGRGINVIDADASYDSLVYKVLQAHRGFKKSSAQLNAVLCERPPE